MRKSTIMLKNFLAGLILIIGFSGCLKNADQSCDANYDPCALVAPASEIQAVQTYLTNNGIMATQHCSGLFYRIEQAGSGTTPNVCSTVRVNYEGKLTNNTVFDATTTMPANLNLSGLITGWKNGLPLIKPGGRIHLYIPPSLGYGNIDYGPIPANSVLVFRVDLIAVL
jgi:FKBP-type peptidyl-prolyl cis-trans isomerase FkpA